ncbi:MAG: protein O-mannosyl-transferase family [Gemmatimonadaceae bacterium]
MRRVAVAAALALAALYTVTLAPGVTFWDAGELIAAIHSLGIPHAPGTPLFVLVARVWSDALWFLPRATATNLFSAACTASAGGITALMIARATGKRAPALAAALCAGAVSTVWLNATETEVYAASLLLSWLALYTAERAGDSGESRWLVLTAYLLSLAVPLHISALVAAPAAALLCTENAHGRRWGDGAFVVGVCLLASGVGTASPVLASMAIIPFVAGLLLQPAGRRALSVKMIVGALAAFSGVLFLFIRAAHDPAINSGNPSNWSSLWAVIGREQYGSTFLWPRRAPFWLQVGNLFQYFDWQFGLGLALGVAPAPARVATSVLFLALGGFGCVAHKRDEARTWRALLVLWLCGGLGLVAYMNFKAGASLGYGFVPDNSHEARERDYFFALAMWVWGVWCGYGVVALAARFSAKLVPIGVLAAALPIALNWRAADRRHGSEAELARTVADALLWSAPPNAVLFTAGDNDSFPLWYLQVVEGARPDVTVVVTPLLGAVWYREQLARRSGVLTSREVIRSWHGLAPTVVSIAHTASANGRPLALALTAGGRRPLVGHASWTLRGVALVRDDSADGPWSAEIGARIDTAVARAFLSRYAVALQGLPRLSTDPSARLMRRLLGCPLTALQVASKSHAGSLDSTCNFR